MSAYRLVHNGGCDFADQIVGDERTPAHLRAGVCTCGANPRLAPSELLPNACAALADLWDQREFSDAESYSHTSLERAVQRCAVELRGVLQAHRNQTDRA